MDGVIAELNSPPFELTVLPLLHDALRGVDADLETVATVSHRAVSCLPSLQQLTREQLLVGNVAVKPLAWPCALR